jgi:deferrochelatase/peroxidase EfeB
MSKLNATDIQGFVLRGYNMPVARYLFLHFESAEKARRLIAALLGEVTTGQRWDRKPQSTMNIAFTHRGLAKLELPDATLLSFPVEFQQGMKHRSEILGDNGCNDPEHWEPLWREDKVHAWIGINGASMQALEDCCSATLAVIAKSGGAVVLGQQDAGALVIDGQPTAKEHFGFTDGFGNPDYLEVDRDCQSRR